MTKGKKKAKTIQVAGRSVPRWAILLGIFLLALVLRGYYLVEYSASPHWDLLTLDTNIHDLMARRIAEEGTVGNEAFFRSPLYPYLLGFIYKTFGPGLLIPRLLNILCGALSCLLIFLMGERIFRPGVGLAAALLAAVYWVFIYFEGELLLVALYITLLLYSLYLMIDAEGRHKKKLIHAGIVMGLATITRPNVLVFFPCILIWLKVVENKGWKEFFLRAACFFVPALLIIFSVTARNVVVGKDKVLLAYQAGVNFYIGNNIESSGHAAQTPYNIELIPESYKWRHGNNIWVNDDVWYCGYYVAEQESRRRLKPSEMQQYWFKRAFASILSDKAAYVGLLLRKCYYFLNAYEIPNNKNLYLFIEEASPLLRFLSLIDFGMILALAIPGMVVTLRRWRRYFLLSTFVICYSVTNIAFFINTRYRVPTIPVFILFGVIFLFWLVEQFRAGRWKGAGALLLLSAALLYLSHTEWFELKDPKVESVLHFNLGNALHDKGNYPAAAREYEQAIRLYPEVPRPFENLCALWSRAGRYDQAVMWAKKGLERFPGNGILLNHLGTAHLRQGRIQEAILALEQALKEEPGDSIASLNLGLALFEAERLPDAKARFEKTLEITCEDPRIPLISRLHLGFIAMKEERYGAARDRFQEVLAVDPYHGDALWNLGKALLKLENPGAAESVLRQLLKIDPNHQEAKALLGSIQGNN